MHITLDPNQFIVVANRLQIKIQDLMEGKYIKIVKKNKYIAFRNEG